MRSAASTILILSLLALGLIACSKRQTIPAPPNVAAIAGAETGPYIVIGHLEHRDQVITVKSGAQGVVYSVRNRDGKVLFDNLTAAQLKTQSPEIHDFIDAATAGHAGLAEPRSMMQLMVR